MNTSEFRIDRGVGAAVMALSICAAGAACGGGDAKDSPSSSAPSSKAAKPGTDGFDPCALISADKITTLFGTPTDGTVTGKHSESPGCIWENPATFESVSIDIGKAGTARGGTLGPPDPGFPDSTTPGPDGMRFVGSGVVEFAAGDRANTVQVAVNSLRGKDADDAAVELAHQVSSQLNG
jgi:hypothetical protein